MNAGRQFQRPAGVSDHRARSELYKGGVKLGVRIGPDVRLAVVGAPGYFADMPRLVVPPDLTQHRCINLRLESQDSIDGREFTKAGQSRRVRVEGQWTCNRTAQIVAASVAGMGLAFAPEDRVLDHIAAGRLIPVLAEWWPTFTGHHHYYPSRRQLSAAFALLVEALRWRGPTLIDDSR